MKRLLMALAYHLASAMSASAQLPPPDILPFRYGEDYSYLHEPGRPQGIWWESLKDIPIAPDGTVRLDVGRRGKAGPEHRQPSGQNRWNRRRNERRASASAACPSRGAPLHRQF